MTKSYLAHIYAFITLICMTASAWAAPAAETVSELSKSVLRVKVNLPDGNLGLGSAVAIAEKAVITNCHVVAEAKSIVIMVNGAPHAATAIKADWHHDLCVLIVDDLDVPIVKIGTSKNLQYDASFFTVAYPDEAKEPVNTYGEVKGLFPMDDSVVIRASSAFRLGASGGGAFDDDGNLVGIITLKSKGKQAYYYYMPVEWVQALMRQPAQPLGAKSEKPFWAMDAAQRPYFMQVVQPYLTQEWHALLKVAAQWTEHEPDTAESWFYLAAAEFATHDYDRAEAHFNKVLTLNHQHSQAIAYLTKIAERHANMTANANANVTLSSAALLNPI